ncbi:nuclear transport factor 2 family protein [Nonomuraea sp. C10]|uniref:nuclear transport factor 2 family protein n=1 Tax=Nonomuraea sp. C10 TaxID=2600577 RepID=UPI0011CDAD91|nr:nuclear transport factor 2 family protein [Nonomuraea sp. C10]TXK34422.1 hypothetical protein FR742_34235 [Nonomuraea sp. C10]
MPDWAALNTLLGDFAWGLDTKDPDAVLACYWPGARYSVQAADGTLYGPHEGHDAIRAHFGGTIGRQTDTRRHVITNVRVASVAGAASTVAAYLTLMVTVDGVLRPRCTGTYRFVVREEGGELRFDESSVTLDGAF